jgi:hypothetical protein
VSLSFGAPYKLGEREQPKTREAYAEDLAFRRHWNKGGTGELLAKLPGPKGHPDPRVRVNIEKVKGPHKAKDLQRIARKYHWINVVRCYRHGHYKNKYLRGWTYARATVSKGGKVRAPKLLKTDLDVKAAARCMVDKLKTLKFPGARAGSRIWVDMKVGPGDDPSAPPEEETKKPGDGEMPLEEMQKGVQAGEPAFEACYREAFEYAPGLWGRLLMRFHVNEHGTLKGVYQWGTYFPDARVSQCILRQARKLKFPKPKGGDIRFVVPLRLFTDRSAHGGPAADGK